ncbi:hypothetical protein TRVL_04065 [Trypanosoma vivax]|nr:hypothetical protein TRVL_04065 [Trypanosoma vivax]
MPRVPFIRKCRAPQLSHVAVRLCAELERLSGACVQAPQSVDVFLFRALLLRRLRYDGFLYDLIVSHRVTSSSFVTLLLRVLQPPLNPRGETGAVSDAVVLDDQAQIVHAVQQEFVCFVADMLEVWLSIQLPRWAPEEVWRCATTLVAGYVGQDDVNSLLLLLPLARHLVSLGNAERFIVKSVRKLQKQKIHTGVLWLLIRCTTSSILAGQFLELATRAVCNAPTASLLVPFGHWTTGSSFSRPTEMQTPMERGGSNSQWKGMQRLVKTFQGPSIFPFEAHFPPFWCFLLHEMICHAHHTLMDESAEPRAQVGALQSLRRILCSFRRHGHVRPLLSLYNSVTTPWYRTLTYELSISEDGPLAHFSSSLGIKRLHPLVYREILLLDAYALMTIGHVGEVATDVDVDLEKHVTRIQLRCGQHLRMLEESAQTNSMNRDATGLHHGARREIERRLCEGIRLSFKLFLRLGAYVAIEDQVRKFPSLGSSLEVGQALMFLGKYTEAVEAFTQFLSSTRQHFAIGLPRYICSAVLGAIEAAARNHSCNMECGEVLPLLFDLYDKTRIWRFPLPAAVVFAAIVRGSVGVASDNPEEGIAQLRLLQVLLERRVSMPKYKNDGLLLKVVELYISLLAKNHKSGLDSRYFDLLRRLQHDNPLLPIYRLALLGFLSAGYTDGLSAVLRCIVPLAPENVTVYLSSLQELPLAALESLCLHIVQSKMSRDEKATLLRVVCSAAECCRCSEGQRMPWRCHLCSQWNRKGAPTCRCCGSLELAMVQCRVCGAFTPTNGSTCLVCGGVVELASAVTGDAMAEEDCTVFALRFWRCTRCNHTNDPQHFFYCAKCASPQPAVESALTQTAFTCTVCNRRNPLGLLRPWCPACGTLNPVASSPSAPPKSLWNCVECLTLNPWLLTHCHACGGIKSPTAARLDLPWFTRCCRSCQAVNAAWVCVCYKCGELVSCQDQSTGEGEESTEGVCPPPELTFVSCPHCGGLYDGEAALTCPKCLACRPHSPCMRWVCLSDNCMEVHLQNCTHNKVLVCRSCGKSHSMAAVAGYYSMLRYRKPISDGRHVSLERAVSGDIDTDCTSLAVQTPGEVGNSMGSHHVACESYAHSLFTYDPPTALVLPVPTGQNVCSSCKAFLHQQNVAKVCPHCHCCSLRTSKHTHLTASEIDVGLRLALKIMLNAARCAAQGSFSSGTLLTLQSLVRVFQCSEEAQLPWCGRDLKRGMRCGVHPRVPVLEDNTVHSAVMDVAEILRCLCSVALLEGGAAHAVSGNSGASWAHQRPWVGVALDLVDLMNHTTDHDELGFDVLAQLCEVVRPQQRTHIYRETRWAYLRFMKLPREWIINDEFCSTCLLPKKCRDLTVETEAARTTIDAKSTCQCLEHARSHVDVSSTLAVEANLIDDAR